MITREQAETCHTFYHATLRNADGTALRCRRNGKLRTWKRKPHEWMLPVKHGLRRCFHIANHVHWGFGAHDNRAEWFVLDPTEADRLRKLAHKLFRLDLDAPLPIIADRFCDADMFNESELARQLDAMFTQHERNHK